VFPITLDIDHPRWMKGLKRLQKASLNVAMGKQRGGVAGTLQRAMGMAQATAAFVSLYTIPALKHDVPVSSRMEPAY
jgi:magnesium-protoporphyrin IX monomethyl ester (oxidative) cyclase